MVTLRANTDICATCTAKAACYNGTDTVAACPLFSFPRTMEDSANCNLCANCIKACPNDAITLTVRKPTKELWFLRNPKIEESFLAMAIMGIVIIQNVTMLPVWTDALAWVNKVTGITSYPVIFTAVFAVGVSVPVALLALAAKVASLGNLESTLKNFARFGYALIPLDVAAHVAHNLFHLLAEGGSVFYTVGALFGGRREAPRRWSGTARSRCCSSPCWPSGWPGPCTRPDGSHTAGTSPRLADARPWSPSPS